MIISPKYRIEPAARFPEKPQFLGSCTAISGLRYYNPSSGRWINRDPRGEKGGKNLYAVLRNRITYRVDFLGLDEVPLTEPGSGLQSNDGIASADTIQPVDINLGPDPVPPPPDSEPNPDLQPGSVSANGAGWSANYLFSNDGEIVENGVKTCLYGNGVFESYISGIGAPETISGVHSYTMSANATPCKCDPYKSFVETYSPTNGRN